MTVRLFKRIRHHIVIFFNAPPQNKKVFIPAVAIFVMTGIFLYAQSASAGIFELAIGNLAELVSNLLLWVASLLGKLLVVIIDILIGISQYNEFSTSVAVTRGWTVVRDISNMFFVLVLLVIAFGTILKIESYKYGNLLPKLVIAAVLINFSKLIAGFFIDISQVVMLTFVNAYADTAAANFTSVLKLQNMLNILPAAGELSGTGTPPSNTELIGVPFLAVIMLVIALMTMIAIVVVFLVRIVALWILVVLSPLAYILSVLPGGAAKYSGEWWSTFGKWVTTGPILAFFLWLSLSVLTTGGDLLGSGAPVGTSQIIDSTSSIGITATLSEASSSKNIMGFMLAIAMMVISLSVASSLGGAAGSVAGNMAGKIKGMGSTSLKIAASPLKAAGAGAKAGAKWGGKRLDDWQAGLQTKFITKTAVGKRLAKSDFGRKYGLGKLATKGIQFRAIAPAWRARKTRLEEQRIGEAPSVAEDILNRFYSRGKDKSDYTSLAAAQRESKAESMIKAAGQEQEIVVARFTDSILDSDGRVKREKIDEAVGGLVTLFANHDPNELLKNTQIADIMNSRRLAEGDIEVIPGQVSQKDFQGLLQHMFGDGENTMRIAKKLEEKGLSGTDGWVKGITRLNEDGDLEWEDSAGHEDWTQDKAAATAAFYMAKREGRRFVAAARRQDYFTEYADENGKMVFRKLSNVGKQNLKKNADSYIKVKLEHVSGELQDALLDNLDLLVEWSDEVHQQMAEGLEGDLSESELKKLDAVIGKFAAGELNLDENKGVNKVALEDQMMTRYRENKGGDYDKEHGWSEEEQRVEAKRVAEEKYARRVHRAVSQRQTSDYWQKVVGVEERDPNPDRVDEADLTEKYKKIIIENKNGEYDNMKGKSDAQIAAKAKKIAKEKYAKMIPKEGPQNGVMINRRTKRVTKDGQQKKEWDSVPLAAESQDKEAYNNIYTNSDDGREHHNNPRMRATRDRAGIKVESESIRPKGGIKAGVVASGTTEEEKQKSRYEPDGTRVPDPSGASGDASESTGDTVFNIPDDAGGQAKYAKANFSQFNKGKYADMTGFKQNFTQEDFEHVKEYLIKRASSTKARHNPDGPGKFVGTVAGVIGEGGSIGPLLDRIMDAMQPGTNDYNQMMAGDFDDMMKKYFDVDIRQKVPGYDTAFRKPSNKVSDPDKKAHEIFSSRTARSTGDTSKESGTATDKSKPKGGDPTPTAEPTSELLNNSNVKAKVQQADGMSASIDEKLSEAMESVTGTVKRFDQTATEMSSSLDGLISSIDDQVRSMGGAISGSDKKAADELIDVLKDMRTQANSGAANSFGHDATDQRTLLWRMQQLIVAMKESGKRTVSDVLDGAREATSSQLPNEYSESYRNQSPRPRRYDTDTSDETEDDSPDR